MTGLIMRPAIALMRRGVGLSDAMEDRRCPLPSGVAADLDLDYAGDGLRGHRLDFYAPEGRPGLPLVIDVHGGGLFYGYKEINKRFCYSVALRGYTVASISYRLVPGVTFDEQVRDVTAAFRYIAAHARTHGGDASEVYLVGDSAGAILAYYAAAVSAVPEVAKAFGDEGSPIRPLGMLLISGPYDMHMGGAVGSMCRYSMGKDRARRPWYEYTFPARIADAYVPPRAVVTTSDADFLRAQVDKACALLAARDVPLLRDVAPARAPDGRKFVHIYQVRHPEWPESKTCLDKAFDFLRR